MAYDTLAVQRQPQVTHTFRPHNSSTPSSSPTAHHTGHSRYSETTNKHKNKGSQDNILWISPCHMYIKLHVEGNLLWTRVYMYMYLPSAMTTIDTARV